MLAQNTLRKNFYVDCMPVEELHKVALHHVCNFAP